MFRSHFPSPENLTRKEKRDFIYIFSASTIFLAFYLRTGYIYSIYTAKHFLNKGYFILLQINSPQIYFQKILNSKGTLKSILSTCKFLKIFPWLEYYHTVKRYD